MPYTVPPVADPKKVLQEEIIGHLLSKQQPGTPVPACELAILPCQHTLLLPQIQPPRNMQYPSIGPQEHLVIA
jgi:hypothetical protein